MIIFISGTTLVVEGGVALLEEPTCAGFGAGRLKNKDPAKARDLDVFRDPNISPTLRRNLSYLEWEFPCEGIAEDNNGDRCRA